MKSKRTFLTAFTLAAISWACVLQAQQISIFFSPNGGTTAAIMAEIDKASTSLDVAAYELTSRPIAAAIIAAKTRGVTCRVIIDPKALGQHTEAIQSILAAGIPLLPDHREKIHHNKYAIVDGHITITGSFNWTNDAEKRNAENTVIIDDTTTATAFARDFAIHWSHSQQSQTKPATKRPEHRPRATLHHPQPSPTI